MVRTIISYKNVMLAHLNTCVTLLWRNKQHKAPMFSHNQLLCSKDFIIKYNSFFVFTALVTKPPSPHSTKTPHKEKGSKPVVDSLHLSRMVALHNKPFNAYCQAPIKVTQIIPSLVWKSVHKEYIAQYPNSSFVEETLRDQLSKTFEEKSKHAHTCSH